MTQGTELRLDLWPRQMQAFDSEATELLFGGASRGGKSHLIRVALISWCLAIPQLTCRLIRKKYSDIKDNHIDGPNGFTVLLAPLVATGQVVITQDEIRFPRGSVIKFQHCQDERQFTSAQGNESHVLVVEEATQISERLIKFFRGWCTMPEEMKAALPEHFKGRFPRILYTANPIGVSVGFFRRHFIRPRKPFEIEEVGAFKRQYIPSRVEDNPSESAEAARGRLREVEDEATASALIEGNWEAPVGDFFPEWDSDRHILPEFVPPKHWNRWRSFDWGSTDPFAVYWLCASDGQQFSALDGQKLWIPRGSVVAYKEWVGASKSDPSKGIGMRNREIAQSILAMSEPSFERVTTLTDSLPFQDRGSEFNIAEVFADEGCILTQAATARVPGWSSLRDGLKGIQVAVEDLNTTPTFYVVQSATFAQEYIPAFPRHATKPRDGAEEGETTHCLDALRYGVHGRIRASDKQEERFDPTKPWSPILSNIPTFDEAIAIVKKHKAANKGASW